MTIENIIKEYGSYIYNYALKLSCHPSSAEDLSQETFLKAWQHLNSLKDENAVKSWLRKICFNLFLTEMRRQKTYSEDLLSELHSLEDDGKMYVSYTPKPEDEVIVVEYLRELQNGCFLAMVRKLTLNQRIAFSLIDMFGLSIEDVSKTLNISKGAVKGLLYRAHMNLDSFFKDHCSILSVNNPCSCRAWIEFSKNRDKMQQKAQLKKHKFIEKLDYTETKYTFDESIRKKINYLYKNMPNKKPSKDWYDNVISAVSDMYI